LNIFFSEANPVGSIHSLSSSAVSGMDPGRVNPLPDQPAEWKGAFSPSSPNSPIKTPSSPERGGQISKQARKRANSSGQILPQDDSHISPRLRRAITPNPTLAYREAGPLSSESDGAESAPLEFPRSKSYDNGSLLGENARGPIFKPKVPPKKHTLKGEISTSSPSTSSPISPSSESRGYHSPQTGSTHVGAGMGDSKGSLNDDLKKSKKSKFGKSKLSKVGLWVSPKKK